MGRLGRYATALVLLCHLLVVPLSLAQTCGKRKVANQLIVNGIESKEGYWPWHVTLFHNDGPSFVYACGGTILDHNTVLTAAHCVMTRQGLIAKELVLVHVGRNRLRGGSNRAQEHEAFQLIVHPEYNVNRIQHDIALIKLTTDITYTDYIQPVCLWNRGDDLNTIEGTWGTVIGFGRDETGNVSNTLREASIPVVSHITCIESNRNAFAYHLTSNMFCAGNRDGIGACNGDSGGGLFFKFNDVWYIRGVVSFTKPHQNTLICDTKEYTVFTDVAKYLKWIQPHMRARSSQSVLSRDDRKRKIKLLPMSTCGIAPYKVTDKILKPFLFGFPWVGQLEFIDTKTSRKMSRCQATLINDFYLVTSARCITDIDFRYTLSSVRLGEYEKNSLFPNCIMVEGRKVCLPSDQLLSIESVTTHPYYNKEYLENNIALIRLRDRADTNQSNVNPICLAVNGEISNLDKPFSQAFGFGSRYGGITYGYVAEICHCLEEETTSQICAKQQFSQGSYITETSGAPLQYTKNDKYFLLGVLSHKDSSCKLANPEVYTNVINYVDWILENIQE
ncbi:testisin-like [Anopheles marshallii]|uniref:testisin-like n=1 Tax=Anopheles marshallii TaxID=1521116 RepID=UPI00237B6C44|nr:testisin-like [Anopheles marshallii]